MTKIEEILSEKVLTRAKELYGLSCNAPPRTSSYFPLDVRIMNALQRGLHLCYKTNEYKRLDLWNDELNKPDYEKVKHAVTSGQIWIVRHIGEVAVMRICQWLARCEAGEGTNKT